MGECIYVFEGKSGHILLYCVDGCGLLPLVLHVDLMRRVEHWFDICVG